MVLLVKINNPADIHLFNVISHRSDFEKNDFVLQEKPELNKKQFHIYPQANTHWYVEARHNMEEIYNKNLQSWITRFDISYTKCEELLSTQNKQTADAYGKPEDAALNLFPLLIQTVSLNHITWIRVALEIVICISYENHCSYCLL